MVQRSYLLKIIYRIIVISLIGLTQGHANFYEEFLRFAEKEFDKAPTLTRKFAIVSQPVSEEYLSKGKEPSAFDPKQLGANVSEDPLIFIYIEQGTRKKRLNFDKTNALALAVSLGDFRRVRKFLPCIPNVNDPKLTAWGYRQPYTLAHMALDPQYPRAFDLSLERQLAIVDALGEKGADFNAIINTNHLGLGALGIYLNPPLAAGHPSGRELSTMPNLRARALLYGADPDVQGSSFQGFRSSYTLYKEFKLSFKYYIEKIIEGAALNPCPKVMTYFQKLASENRIDLNDIFQQAKKIKRLEKRISRAENQIKKLSLQNTKRSRRNIQHLQNIRNEILKEKDVFRYRMKRLLKKVKS